MKKNVLFLGIICFLCVFNGWGLTTGDYQTAGDASFSASTNWEIYNGSTWVAASLAPTSTDGVITIQSGHNVITNSSISVDQLIIIGNLTLSGSISFTIADGSGTDLIIKSGGFMINSTPSGNGITATGTWQIESGGTYIHNGTSPISTPFGKLTLDDGSNFIYRGNSSLRPSLTIANKTYYNLKFESTSGTYSDNLGTGINDLTINGTLTIGSNVALNFGSWSGKINTNNLTIQSGGVFKIDAARSVLVSGTLTNNAGNSGLVIESNSSGTGSIITSSTVSGTVNRYCSGGANGRLHYVSMPVSSSTGATLIDADKGNYNVYEYTSGSGWGRVYSADNLQVGKGYYVAYNADKTISFLGTLNTGNTTAPISSTNGNWNLIGNPLTAPVEIAGFIADNSGSLMSPLYFWDDDGSAGTTYDTSDYATRNSVGYTRASNSSHTPDPYIAVGQGFFVQTKTTGTPGTTVTFNANRRSAQNPLFFIPEPDLISRMWLSVTDQKNAYNEILIAFKDDATPLFDDLYDGFKLRGNPNISLCSYVKEDTNGLIIQTLPPDFDKISVKLGLFAGKGGLYRFNLRETENLNPDVKIILEDKANSTFTDLSKNPNYYVNLSPGEYSNRFVIHFNPDISFIKEQSCEGIRILQNNNQLLLEQEGEELEGCLEITNIMGQKLKEYALNGEIHLELDLSDLPVGCYLYSYSGVNFFKTGKIVIR